MTKASLHYHYPGKAELGEALIERYTQRFTLALDAIDEGLSESPAKLEAYVDLYASVLRGERMCLCGMLAAEYDTLPEGMRAAVIRFFDANEAWLEAVLTRGLAEGELSFAGSARDGARLLVGALEGAMLVARPYGDVERFLATAERLVASLAPAR